MAETVMTFNDLAAAVQNPYKGKSRFLVETLDEALVELAVNDEIALFRKLTADITDFVVLENL